MLDTEPLYKFAWQQTSAALGYELDDRSYLKVVGRSIEDGERELVAQFGMGFPLAAFRAGWADLWRQRVDTGGIPLKPGLLEFLSFLDARAIPVAVATSSDHEYAQFSLGKAGLPGRFRVVVTGDQVANGKPAPDIYLEAARRLDVEPARCVALEDSDAGILAASRAAMLALMIPDLKAPSADAAAAAYRVLRSLDEARLEIARMLREAGEAGRAGTRHEAGAGH